MVTKNSIKYFAGYGDTGDVRGLCIKLPRMIGYIICLTLLKTVLLINKKNILNPIMFSIINQIMNISKNICKASVAFGKILVNQV